MKEQTAVEFLHSKILLRIGLDNNDILELRELVLLAKAIEKQQHGETKSRQRRALRIFIWWEIKHYFKTLFKK